MDSPTLLCIDDRPPMLELRKATLESQGYSVKLKSGGYTAIKTLEETSVATVLLDVQTRRHRRGSRSVISSDRFRAYRSFLLSAYSEVPERLLWLVDDYVMKSEMPERLIPIIDRAHKVRPHADEPQRGTQGAVC
jgi:DNA-binding NtrC family response regulator